MRAESELRRAEALLLGDVTGAAPLAEGERAAVFERPPAGTREERLAVYAHGYTARLTEALEGDFPAVRRILGAGAFAALTRRYLASCPPRTHDLGHAGDRLPRFLASDVLAGELPFLPDLAALERALVDAFVAADAASLSFTELASMPCDAIPDLVVAPAPGVDLIRSRWPLVELLRSKDAEDEEISIDLAGPGSTVLVYRRGLAALCDAIDEDEAAIVEASRWGGVTLAELQARAERHDDADLAARLAEAFRRLVVRGAFTTITRTGDTGSLI